MRTGAKFATFMITGVMIAGVLCVGALNAADATSTHSQRKSKKPELAPLPSGPQGPVPQIPLDSIPAVAPQVSYHDGQLTILAPNSTLGDILRAVRKQTAAEMEIPSGSTERVVTHLGPGPAREVVAELLNGSRFNYVLLGSPSDATSLTRIVLVAKTSTDAPSAATTLQPPPPGGNPNMAPPPEGATDATDATDAPDAPDENADDSAAAAAEAEQPPAVQDQQQGIRTPQQMLQEMQQRQLQMQQQLAPGQPPIPGGMGQPQRPQDQ